MKKYLISFLALGILLPAFSFAGTHFITARSTNCSGGTGPECGGTVSDSFCQGQVSFPDTIAPNTSMTIAASMTVDYEQGLPPTSCTLGTTQTGLIVNHTGGWGSTSGAGIFLSPQSAGTYTIDASAGYGRTEGSINFYGQTSRSFPYGVTAASAPTLELSGRAAFLKHLFTPVFAQESAQTVTSDEVMSQDGIIADVEISQAQVQQLASRRVSASLTLHADIAQTGIRYGLALGKKETNGAYMYVYQEVVGNTISLGQNELKSFEAIFNIPQSVPEGTYRAFMTAYTDRGILLASQYASDITLLPSTPLATISCVEPTDASATEATCTVRNTSKTTQMFVLYTVVRAGTTLFSADAGTPQRQTLTLRSLQSQTISFPLTPNISQTLVSYLLTSNEQEVVDRTAVTTRVVSKPSLDNVFMVADDKNITVSAVTRMMRPDYSVSVRFESPDGVVCGESEAQVTGIRTDVAFAPSCVSGTARVVLFDQNKQVLDQTSIPFALDPSKAPQASDRLTLPWWGWVIAGFVFMVLVILVIIKRRSRI